jgi:hypothetical protein
MGLPYSCNSIAIQFATKKQLKDLTLMFCFQIACYKLYKKDLFSYVFTRPRQGKVDNWLLPGKTVKVSGKGWREGNR